MERVLHNRVHRHSRTSGFGPHVKRCGPTLFPPCLPPGAAEATLLLRLDGAFALVLHWRAAPRAAAARPPRGFEGPVPPGLLPPVAAPARTAEPWRPPRCVELDIPAGGAAAAVAALRRQMRAERAPAFWIVRPTGRWPAPAARALEDLRLADPRLVVRPAPARRRSGG